MRSPCVSMLGVCLGSAMKVNVWMCALATDRENERGSSKNTNVNNSEIFKDLEIFQIQQKHKTIFKRWIIFKVFNDH